MSFLTRGTLEQGLSFYITNAGEPKVGPGVLLKRGRGRLYMVAIGGQLILQP